MSQEEGAGHMLVISCPHCGQRDVAEFTYGGDASRPRPDTTEPVDDATWTTYLYLRDDPAGPHREYFHHVLGCRQWLTVTRDTVTDEVLDVRLPPSAAGSTTSSGTEAGTDPGTGDQGPDPGTSEQTGGAA